MKKTLFTIFGTVLLFPLFASKALGLTLQDFQNQVYRPPNLPGSETGSLSAENKVVNIIDFLIKLILYASGSVAVIMLVYAGVRLITAGGDTEQKENSVKTIRFAGMGLLVVILAYALVTNVINLIYSATS